MLARTPSPRRLRIRRTPATIKRLTHNETPNQTATRNHASTNRPSVTLVRPAVSRTPEAPARTRARHLPLLQHHLPIHEHVLNPDRRLMRLLERRAIDHGRRIEDGDIGEHPGPHEAAIGETNAPRRERRHLAHRELERHQLAIPPIAAEAPG